MLHAAPRSALRYSVSLTRSIRPRRLFSTAPPAQRSYSWKNSSIRWALAIGGIYYYNTSDVFAEEPTVILPPSSPSEETSIPTLESIAEARQSKQSSTSRNLSSLATPTSAPPEKGPLEQTEGEASQEGAFNEETGEINWDCPCLGGMAHGLCGENFRAAFRCFVFSKEEPKGMDCIDQFRSMQDCFRQHDIYGGEDEDDEGPDSLDPNHPEVDEPSVEPPLDSSTSKSAFDEPSVPVQTSRPVSSSATTPQTEESKPSTAPPAPNPQKTSTSLSVEQKPTSVTAPRPKALESQSEGEKLVSKAWHDIAPSKEGK